MIGGARLSGKVQCDPVLFAGDAPAWIDVPEEATKHLLRSDFNILYEMVRLC